MKIHEVELLRTDIHFIKLRIESQLDGKNCDYRLQYSKRAIFRLFFQILHRELLKGKRCKIGLRNAFSERLDDDGERSKGNRETPLTLSTHFYFPIRADLGIDVTCTLARPPSGLGERVIVATVASVSFSIPDGPDGLEDRDPRNPELVSFPIASL